MDTTPPVTAAQGTPQPGAVGLPAGAVGSPVHHHGAVGAPHHHHGKREAEADPDAEALAEAAPDV